MTSSTERFVIGPYLTDDEDDDNTDEHDGDALLIPAARRPRGRVPDGGRRHLLSLSGRSYHNADQYGVERH